MEGDDAGPPLKQRRLEPVSGLGDADEDDEARARPPAQPGVRAAAPAGPYTRAPGRCPSSTAPRRGGAAWRPRAPRALSCARSTACRAPAPSATWPPASPPTRALHGSPARARTGARRTAGRPRSWWPRWGPGAPAPWPSCVARSCRRSSPRCLCRVRFAPLAVPRSPRASHAPTLGHVESQDSWLSTYPRACINALPRPAAHNGGAGARA